MRTQLTAAAAIVLGLGISGISGCAGTAGPNGMARESKMDSDIDYGKVISVNEWAVNRHATVVWVNYPRVRAKENVGATNTGG